MNSGPPDNNAPVIELAIFKLKPEFVKRAASLRVTVHQILRRFKGFREYIPMEAVGNPQVLADYVLWDSAEEAIAAATQFPKDPEARAFMAALESTLFFEHFKQSQKE